MKKLLIGIVIFISAIVAGLFILEYWLDKNLPSIINANEDRSYDIQFEDVDIRLFNGTIDFKNIMIVPLDSSLPTVMSGSVRKMSMSGVKLVDLVFGRKFTIRELRFEEPAFRLVRNDSSSSPTETSQAFQDLFGDIVSRGMIQDFVLLGGTAEMFMKGEEMVRFGQFTDLNIHAMGLQTDSVLLTHAIPFQLEDIHTSLKNLKININEDQVFEMDAMEFDFLDGQFDFHDISLHYQKPWREVAQEMGVQMDMIEFDLKTLSLFKLNTNSDIYGQWNIIAEKVLLDSLIFHDSRDKNIPRPPDEVKGGFETLLETIPFPLEVDTVEVINSSITYSEIAQGKSALGSIVFSEVDASIFNVFSIDSLQKGEDMRLHAKAKLNEVGPVTLEIIVPYNQEVFELNASVEAMNLEHMNSSLEEMASVSIASGKLNQMNLQMKGNGRSSQNQFRFEYEDLSLSVLKTGDDGETERKGLLSSAANLAVRKENLQSKRNYRNPTYTTARNPYRGPFNFMWLSVKDGIMEVVPTGLAKNFLPTPEKDE